MLLVPIFIALLLVPYIAFAHVNWFVEPSPDLQPVENYSLLEPISLMVASGFLVILTGAFIVNWVLLNRNPLQTPLRYASIVNLTSILRIVFGVSLLISAINGSLFAPHFVPNTLPFYVLSLQALAGVLMIAGKGLLFSGSIVVLLFFYLLIERGLVAILEYINLVGIALFVMIMRFTASIKQNHPDDFSLYNEQAALRYSTSLTLLRFTLGIALITLGLSEKILNPELAMDFMRQYENVNFMQHIVPTFSHRLFILCCGATEVLFGLIYLLGWVPRINTACLAFFLIASNSYFYFTGESQLALMELLGHSSLIATALLVLVSGKSNSYKVTLVHLQNLLLPPVLLSHLKKPAA